VAAEAHGAADAGVTRSAGNRDKLVLVLDALDPIAPERRHGPYTANQR
jgi:hypothetical protein